MSGDVPLTRMIGLQSSAAMAETALCMLSSPMCPCSQSMITPFNRSAVRSALLPGGTHVKAAQRNDLSMSHARDRDECHQGEFISLESVEKAKPRVLHLGGVSGSECGDGHVALRFVVACRQVSLRRGMVKNVSGKVNFCMVLRRPEYISGRCLGLVRQHVRLVFRSTRGAYTIETLDDWAEHSQ